MEIIFYCLLFVLGLTLGSFYNVIGLRIPKNQPFISGRSACPKCKKQLHWYELIPVLSYLIQAGNCRDCGQSIQKLYPFIEAVTGVSFMLSYWRFGLTLEFGLALLVVSLAVIVVVTDVTYYVIPNKLLLFFTPFLIVGRIVSPLTPWWSPILGALTGFSLLFLIIFASRGGMGLGDLKYFTILGIVFGFPSVLLIFILSVLSGAIANFIPLIQKKVLRQTKVPFGPYISLATLTVLIYGEQIVNGYLTLFF